MEPTRRAVLGTVGGLGVTAGCTGGGSETPTARAGISYSVVNRDAGPHDVLLAATPNGVTGYEFTYADGETRRVEATDLGELPAEAFDGAIRLTPVGEGVDRRELSLAAGEQRRGSFDGLPADTQVFTAIAPGGEQIRSYGFSWCDVGRMELDIQLRTGESYEESVRCLDAASSG
ncbi:hypothetical protein NDI56_11305 [Haloarcula sp. S1CR25-12]|uniref:Lipoprotein n=1 Tax=Haloarcula saliterrae TaxID=2950534 RepID=A0ABU2FCJ6_9EURY|nr:hypothetical protein [Haloarcula sp. S1CR25-12]MDS0259980.1 hypothetical protein [Haloarcula sp. S1CR25-12]